MVPRPFRCHVVSPRPTLYGAAFRSAARLSINLSDDRELTSSIYCFDGLFDSKKHFALRFGDVPLEAPLVRVHSERIT